MVGLLTGCYLAYKSHQQSKEAELTMCLVKPDSPTDMMPIVWAVCVNLASLASPPLRMRMPGLGILAAASPGAQGFNMPLQSEHW